MTSGLKLDSRAKTKGIYSALLKKLLNVKFDSMSELTVIFFLIKTVFQREI